MHPGSHHSTSNAVRVQWGHAPVKLTMKIFRSISLIDKEMEGQGKELMVFLKT